MKDDFLVWNMSILLLEIKLSITIKKYSGQLTNLGELKVSISYQLSSTKKRSQKYCSIYSIELLSKHTL